MLAMCDGEHNFASPAFLPQHRAILRELIGAGLAFRCPRGFTGSAPVILGAHWSVTGRCNLKCRHCYMNAPEGQAELPLAAMERIVKALCESGATGVKLTGGEPLIRKDFFLLIDLITENGLAVTNIYTNATLIDDRVLAQFEQAGVHPVFHVSFDGVGAHEIMRNVPGAEANTLRGIRCLLEAGYTVTVATSVDENVLPTLEKTYELMREMGVHAWGMARPMAAGCGKKLDRIGDERFAQACEAVLLRWKQDGKPFTLGLEAFYSEAVTPDMHRVIRPIEQKRYSCSGCRQYPHITHKGDLLPCACYAETEYGGLFGNLPKDGWQKAWNNPTLRKTMDVTLEEVYQANPECRSCVYLPQCRTGCRVNAVLYGNGLTGLDTLTCGIFHGGLRERFASIGGQA